MRNRGHVYVEQVGPGRRRADGPRPPPHPLGAGAGGGVARPHRGGRGPGGRRRRRRRGKPLRAGQRLTWERPPWDEPEAPTCTAVLLEDEDLLAVAKPRGLPTLPGGGLYLESTLLAVVRRRDPGARPGAPAGARHLRVVLFARTPDGAGRAAAGHAGAAHPQGLPGALRGPPRARDAFDVDAPIGEVPYPPTGHAPRGRAGRAPVAQPGPGAGAARGRRRPSSLLEVEIETGRPHQIRIHLAFAGHPLVGDPLYGPGGLPFPGGPAVPGRPGLPPARLAARVRAPAHRGPGRGGVRAAAAAANRTGRSVADHRRHPVGAPEGLERHLARPEAGGDGHAPEDEHGPDPDRPAAPRVRCASSG